MEGILGGYITETDRRVFYPSNDPKKEMAIKPANIYLLKETESGLQKICISDKSILSKNLVDVQDRIGSISMHEVIMSKRDDVATFLLARSSTCLDIAECCGYTVRSMTLTPIIGAHPVNDVIRQHVRKVVRKEQKKARSKEVCERCGIKASDLRKEMKVCINCLDAVYCSRECQVSDWKDTHKKECAEREMQLGLELGQASPIPAGESIYNRRTRKHFWTSCCRLPKDVKPNEKFWVKVQTDGMAQPLLIYDETRYVVEYFVRVTGRAAQCFLPLLMAKWLTDSSNRLHL